MTVTNAAIAEAYSQRGLDLLAAGSAEEALMGLKFLAEQAMGPGVEAILAQGLTALIYQTMRETGPFLKYVFTEIDSSDPVRSLIRENKIGMLATYIDRAAARLTPTGAQAVPENVQAWAAAQTAAKTAGGGQPPPRKS